MLGMDTALPISVRHEEGGTGVALRSRPLESDIILNGVEWLVEWDDDDGARSWEARRELQVVQ